MLPESQQSFKDHCLRGFEQELLALRGAVVVMWTPACDEIPTLCRRLTAGSRAGAARA